MTDFFKKKRTIVFLVLCGLIIIVLLAAYLRLALQPVPQKAKNPPVIERGSIVDRSGFPLAVQTNFYRIGLSSKDVKDEKAKEFSKVMAYYFGLTETELFEKINKKREYVTLKKKASQSEYEIIYDEAKKHGFNFLNYEKLPGRIYPNNSLASHLIGYMGDEGYGLAGIEFSQQDILSPEIDEQLETAEQGKNVYLSIDANLQYKLEQIAAKTMESTQAENMMLLAVDSTNGEILSYISLPSVNLNEYGSTPEEYKKNRPINDSYEPGSVFKIFTLGIVYDHRGISPNDNFLCDGAYEHKLSSGETIRIKCLEKHGWLTPRDALKYSCNDVFGQISDQISEEEFITRIKQLGFGERTGIQLSGETPGKVKGTDDKYWSARSKPTIAIGQEISVSALQMVQAATAIANGGVPLKLSVIRKITNKDGSVFYEHRPEYKERVFNKSTADYVLSCMETTAKTGTGSRANIGDVSIGVKTGTAQMADKINGGYSDTDFLSSCIAIFPVDNPQIILYIVVQKAKGETYGGRIVAPVIAEAADTIIDYMGMSRGGASSLEHNGVITIPYTKEIKIGTELPDFTGYSKKELLPLAERTDSTIKLNINGSGWVISQNPEPGSPVTENMIIELYLE
ncbi:MAG: transpeptidase family protein [Treponema sp.]|nr:transpeptidase family protein [Treponema sp.]